MGYLNYATMDRHVLEAIKTLKSNIQFSGIDHPIKSIVTTSSEASAGKTSVSVMLAAAMAEGGKKTLIIETDLRKPNTGNTLGQRNEYGLANVITKEKTLEECIKPTVYENLDFLDCGFVPPNPIELVSSQAFRNMMDTVYEQYDMVIYDTPPLGMFIDSALIAEHTDGVIIVISGGEVDYRIAQDVVEQLQKARARILGVVLNKIVIKRTDYYYSKYYNKYYDSYYTDRPGGSKHKRPSDGLWEKVKRFAGGR